VDRLLHSSDVVAVADDAVEDVHEAGVVEVAAERSVIAEQRAIADRQRPEVGDAAAEVASGVARESAVADRQRGEIGKLVGKLVSVHLLLESNK
jgi:hypothetical protein